MPVYPTRDLPLRIMYHATEGIIKLHMVNKFMDNLPLCQEPNKSNLKIKHKDIVCSILLLSSYSYIFPPKFLSSPPPGFIYS